jgi:hypothetical protein
MHRQKESGLDGNLPAEPADGFQVTPGANDTARDLTADLRSQIKPFQP